jgi:hypothetical protein
MLQENGGTDSLSCTRTAVRWERKQERSSLSSWFLCEILSFRICRVEVLHLGDTAQRNCMMFETFLDNLMISPSRVKSSSNIWPLKMKWILCFETLALIDQRGGAISQKKGNLRRNLLSYSLFSVRLHKLSSFCVPVGELSYSCVALCCFKNSHFSMC